MESPAFGLVDEAVADKPVSEWDLRALWENLRGCYSAVGHHRGRGGARWQALPDDDLVNLSWLATSTLLHADTGGRMTPTCWRRRSWARNPCARAPRRYLRGNRPVARALYEMDYLEGVASPACDGSA